MSTRAERTAVIEELEKNFKEASGIFIADNHKINVEKITKLRSDFRNAGVRYLVVKNKLAQTAAKHIGRDELVAYFNGPTGMAITTGDGTAPAKIIRDFQKDNKDLLSLKAAVVDGSVFSAEDAIRLADLPSLEALLSQLLGCLEAPMGKLVGSLSGVFNKLTGTLTALKDKKASE
ncbi:MAG: 50S ribosomal protein L10 [Chitinispirillaceae bacterium]|nr:50S ribosomal protein L10 [Chitinispirillaceae bacterium]